MSQMYKVFYNERTVFFVNDFKYYFENNDGLFYKYNDRVQLSYLLELFSNVRGFKDLFIYHDDIDFIFNEFCSLFTVIDAAGGLVKDENNSILVIKRRGLWDLPKGKLEISENPEAGALREVEEECGISNIRLSHHLETTYHTYPLNQKKILKRTFWYEMLYNGNEIPKPQLLEEITEAKWIHRSAINQITQNTFPSIIEVLKKAKIIN